MASDVFPQTMSTWIGAELRRGRSGQLNVNAHLMSTYAWPLKVYYLGTNSRWLGEPDDVIGGFFASRLGQDDFLQKWQTSGLRLRRWLMNGFCFYLKELRRQRQRDADHVALPAEDPVTFSGDPDAAVDRASIVAFVRQAMQEAESACAAEGLEAHWSAFIRHHIDGAPFREIATELGVDAARAAVMSRTATRKFRAALREVLLRDGISPEQIDAEIRSLLEVTGS